VNGGYELQRQASDISVADVIQAIEGPITLTDCSKSDNFCLLAETCNLGGNWQFINELIVERLQTISIKEMTENVTPFRPA